MEGLISIKGPNGTITAYEDRVVISRNTFGGFTSQGGFAGDRTYFYKDISSIEYKKPGMINGYIKIILPGTQETNAASGIFATSQQSMSDPNTIILRAFKSSVPKLADQLYELIMTKMDESKNKISSAPPAPTSSPNEYDDLKKLKELMDMGAITEEEYTVKKKQILGI